MNHINFKNESIFFLKTFWTNGFLIWSVLIWLTGISSNVQLVCEFRETLWFNQLMWVFFVPMIYQIAFRFFLHPRITPQFRASHSRLKILFVSFVLAIIISSVIIEYAYFAGEVMLIIPEHYKNAQGPNYDVVPWLKALHLIFIIVFLAGDRYRKHLVQTGDIVEPKNENLNTERQIFFLIIGFTLSLSAFITAQTITNAPLSDFCQTQYS